MAINNFLAFQSTLPVGGATVSFQSRHDFQGYFNPRSPWGERRFCKWIETLPHSISIHAPRGGSDLIVMRLAGADANFNPRSPWGERLCLLPIVLCGTNFNPRSPWGERQGHESEFTGGDEIFQSTLPVGGATTTRGHTRRLSGNFNPRSPWGERRVRFLQFQANRYFNPRSPWGERQPPPLAMLYPFSISIHAPRGGSDKFTDESGSVLTISIHAPRGGSDRERLIQDCL